MPLPVNGFRPAVSLPKPSPPAKAAARIGLHRFVPPAPSGPQKAQAPMSLQKLRDALPRYARDIAHNLAALAADPVLGEQQRAGAFVAAAIAARNPVVSAALLAEFAPRLSAPALEAAKACAAVTAMTNVYYRFTQRPSNDYDRLPARLRMNALGCTGTDKQDFELWSVAVSAVNGCGVCADGHARTARDLGLTPEAVQTAVRIAAVVQAAATVLDAEAASAAALPLAAE